MRRCAAGLLASALLSCGPLVLPPRPQEVVIDDFNPKAVFSAEDIVVDGRGFDPNAAANEVRFPDGLAARARPESTTTRLVVSVPDGMHSAGPIQVTTPRGTSRPSEDVYFPRGPGYPSNAVAVGDVRFRQRPAGLVDFPDCVAIASTLVPVVLTETRLRVALPGTPTAMLRAGAGDDRRVLVAVSTPAGGRACLADLRSAEPPVCSARATAAEQRRTEHHLLPGRGAGVLARSLGTDPRGNWSLATWRTVGGVPSASRRAVKGTVLGAAADPDGDVIAVVRRQVGARQRTGLLRLSETDPAADEWRPGPWHEAGAPLEATGLVTFLPADPPLAAVALENGDVGLLADGASDDLRIVTMSYEPVRSLLALPGPGGALLAFTKTLEGALYAYDGATRELVWSLALRGQPGLLAADAEFGEIAVANDEENRVDLVDREGRWLGSVTYPLGLGAADGGEGGVVAGFEYLPELPQDRPMTMLVLAREVRAVLGVNADTLGLQRVYKLAAAGGEARGLAVTPDDLLPYVLHEGALGRLDVACVPPPEGATESDRVPDGCTDETGMWLVSGQPVEGRPDEWLLVSDLPDEPRTMVFPPGLAVVGFDRLARVYERAPRGALTLLRDLELPAGAVLAALLPHYEDPASPRPETTGVLLVWESPEATAAAGAAVYLLDALRGGGEPAHVLDLDPQYAGLRAGLQMAVGPVLLFADSSRGPAAVLLRPDLTVAGAIDSEVSTGRVLGASPDRRVFFWSLETGGEHALRLMTVRADEPVWEYGTMRLPGRPASPRCDPSGAWAYVPVPGSDQLVGFY